MEDQQQAKKESLAREIMHLSRDSILMHLRFLDVSLSKLHLEQRNGLKGIGTDASKLYYDVSFVLRRYKEEASYVTRCYLHSLLHLIFYHPFGYDKVDSKYWDVAVDIAVEASIMEMNLAPVRIQKDARMQAAIDTLKKECPKLTAEKIYRYFLKEDVSEPYLQEMGALFRRDEHSFWRLPEVLDISLGEWKRLSERIKTDLKTFSKGQGGSDALETNLEEANKDRYDYGEILQRFTVMGEEIKPSEDEFDYIYYNYGMENYGNMPLIEPLEYRETKKIREFVIAIDTSASCRGKIVQAFLRKTYSILKSSENFFERVNIHILQCDHEIQEDTLITNQDEFEDFMKNGKLKGFGATDFRPVFSYIEDLIVDNRFENLKGLIYFTDGYGVYPEVMPDYDVIFAFLNEDERRMPVPTWAIQVILEEDDLEQETGQENA